VLLSGERNEYEKNCFLSVKNHVGGNHAITSKHEITTSLAEMGGMEEVEDGVVEVWGLVVEEDVRARDLSLVVVSAEVNPVNWRTSRSFSCWRGLKRGERDQGRERILKNVEIIGSENAGGPNKA
jgi:hypothetical protein